MAAEDLEKYRRKARALEKSVDQAKAELARRVLEGRGGGGKVSAQVSGDQTLLSLEIAADLVDPARAPELKAAILEAVNDGLTRSKELTRILMGKATGGVKIPGI